MTKKQFEILRLIIVAVMIIAIGLAVKQDIAFVPPVTMVLSAGLIFFFFRKIDEVVVDERDYKLGGQSARITFNITAVTLTALGGAFMAYGVNHPEFYRPGYLLLYIVFCLLL